MLDALASVEAKRGNFGAALALSREAVAICEDVLGPRHPSTGIRLDHYADVLQRLKHHDLARQARERALAIAKDSAAADGAALHIDWDTLRREAGR